MDKPCPNCGEPLEPLGGWEMGSAPRCFRGVECQIAYVAEAPGFLTEVDDSL